MSRVRIDYLCNHLNLIPVLAEWFYNEWSHLAPGKSLEDIKELVGQRIYQNKIPTTLVAFIKGEAVGTVCLKSQDLVTHTELSPWLAALYVSPENRKNGIGSALVSAIEEKATDFRESKLYLYTPSSAEFYGKLGWKVREKAIHHNTPITIMEKYI